jgi:O-antigen/teichoic acid export membrane protein
LVLNVVLNLLLIPSYGLAGAVAATTTSNFAVLGIVFALDRRLGMRVQPQTAIVALLPAALMWGPWIALAVLVIGTGCLIANTGLLTVEERRRMASVWQEYRARLGPSGGC